MAALAQRTAALVAMGSAVAAVLGYLAMERWLDALAYRIEMQSLPFVTVAAITLALGADHRGAASAPSRASAKPLVAPRLRCH